MENNGIVPYAGPVEPLCLEALAAFRRAMDHAVEEARRLAAVIVKALAPALRAAVEIIASFKDSYLRIVATGKEWHLMKHARKARVRKKYRNLLLRRWLALLAAGVEEEDDAAA